jgi:hypothetical protein
MPTVKRKPKNFYSNALSHAERIELQHAADVEGIDQEIALTRFKIRQLSKHMDPEELSRCTSSLCRMLLTKYTLEGKNKKDFKEAITNVLRDIALPLGIKIIETVVTKKI